MADSDRKNARTTTRTVALFTLLVLVILVAVIVFRGCQESEVSDDRIDPDDPLPGTEDATGHRYTPDAAPLLRAA